jgi:hypothetical protein
VNEIERAMAEHKTLRLADTRFIGEHSSGLHEKQSMSSGSSKTTSLCRQLTHAANSSKLLNAANNSVLVPDKFLHGNNAILVVKRWFITMCKYMNSDGLLDTPLPYALATHRDVARFACELGVRHFVQFVYKKPESGSYADTQRKRTGKISSKSRLSAVPPKLLELQKKLSTLSKKDRLGYNYKSLAEAKRVEKVLFETIGLPPALLRMMRDTDPAVPEGEAPAAPPEAGVGADETTKSTDSAAHIAVVEELFANYGKDLVMRAVKMVQGCFRRYNGQKGSIVRGHDKSSELAPVLAMLFGYLHGLGPRGTAPPAAGSIGAVAAECKAEVARLVALLGPGTTSGGGGSSTPLQQLQRQQLHGLHRQLRLLRDQAIAQAGVVRAAHLQYLQVSGSTHNPLSPHPLGC